MLATVLMDSNGRRKLMVISAGGMFVSTVAIIMALIGAVPKLVALGAVAGFVGFFEVGLGPIPWLIGAEMFEADQVAVAQSFACQINWFCNFIIGVGFPSLQCNTLDAYYGNQPYGETTRNCPTNCFGLHECYHLVAWLGCISV